ncbi:MAG: hypothetical protein ACK5R1_13555 [Planctomycetota bacterium]|jgi:hypothetical protein
MASIRHRDVFKLMCFKLGLIRPSATVRRTGRKGLPLAFERLEPRQLMSRTTLGGSLSLADDFVGPRAEFKPAQGYSTGLQRSAAGGIDLGQMGPFHPSVYSPPSGRESGFLPPPTPPVSPPPPGTPPRPPVSPPTSPPGGSGNSLKVDVWGDGINNPKIMEGDEFYVNVRWEGNHSTSPKIVNVRIWADIDYDNQVDDGEMYATQTAMPNGFARNRWRALDDGPWPGNTTSVDLLPVHVSVDYGDWQMTGAPVHNVKPMFEEPPKYKFGVDDAGRDYVEVEVDFWDPGIKDLFKLTLETSGSGSSQPRSYSSDWMPADSKGDILNYIKYRFYTDRLYNLGDRFTLTVADDDSGLDRRWNLWQAVEHNDNDSNSNSVVDLLDRNLSSADPDIVELGGRGTTWTNWLETDAELSVRYDQSAQRPLMLSPDGELVLFYDPSVIRIWDSPKKEKLFAPYGGIPGEIGHRFTGTETLWIEGYNKGSTEVYATWTPNTPGYFVNEYMNHLVSHSFTVNVAGIDVDIDSDNDEIVNPNFERDDWNEYLEDSPYALGKFVGGVTESSFKTFETSYIPFVVELDGFSPNLDQKIHFSVNDKFEVMRFNNKSATPNIPLTNNFYRPSELGIVGSGLYTFWVRRKYAVGIEKYVDDRRNSGTITVSLMTNEGTRFPFSVEDTVKVLGIAHNNADPINVKDANGEFPMALQADEAVRDAGASKDVYGDFETADAKKFAVKRLTEREIKEFTGINNQAILNFLTKSDFTDGFFARMYLDHCDTVSTEAPRDGGGRYVISFRGSQVELEDWLTNLNQGMFGASSQYHAALSLGQQLEQHFQNQFHRPFTLSLSGHSLGGGLASAAVYSSGLKAHTFNAAGVNPDVFWLSSSVRQAGLPSIYPKAYSRYQVEQEQRNFNLITAYQLVNRPGTFDVPCLLTWLQRTGANGTKVRAWVADGRAVEREGLYDLKADNPFLPDEYDTYVAMTGKISDVFRLADSTNDFISRIKDLVRSTSWIDLYNVYVVTGKLGDSHKMPSVLYGLLHDDAFNWNAYDHLGNR